MQRCASHLAAAALALVSAAATAQVQRNFPATALRGEFSVVQGVEARLNGQPARLAPGSRIRDLNNFLVVSGAIAGTTYSVNYTLESNGMLLDVWLLRPEEKAREPWPRNASEAKAWTFDPVGQFWTKP